MSGLPGWQEAVALPWLRPSTAALLALTADPPDGRAILVDPAAVAHVLRFARPTPGPLDSMLSQTVLYQPSLASNAALLLDESRQEAPEWETAAPLACVNTVVSAASRVAAELAGDGRFCSPDMASAVTRLCALGWYALHTVNPDSEALSPNSESSARKSRTQASVAALTRRLVGRWRLPPWAAATVSYLRFHTNDAVRFGAHAGLFTVVQTAVCAAERRYGSLGLCDPKAVDQSALLEEAEHLTAAIPAPTSNSHSPSEPASKSMLVRLLSAVATARRASGATWLSESEERVETLGEALQDLRSNFDTAVRDAKLTSLAEFAAGASHEINNPLAVISGHAQLLLNREPDPERRKQLGTIVRQAKRIHDLLQGTLQFARPPRPTEGRVRIHELSESVAAEIAPESADRRVRLEVEAGDTDVAIRADGRQVRQALLQILRNAVAAAPEGGRVVLKVEATEEGVDLVVEDNGPGPATDDLEHLFDPFFSGRVAGRGRGLGLSIAWRLAKINCGDIRYEPTTGGPTRFVLSFPAAPAHLTVQPLGGRKCA